MKKKSSVALIVSVGACVVVVLGALSRICQAFGWLPTWGNKSETEPEETYTITYRMIEEDGQTVSVIPAKFFAANGSYPTTYTAGKAVTVDDLNDYVWITQNEDLKFDGWYEDPAKTIAFDGEISASRRGDVVLYAVTSSGRWTSFY